jgi:hypothetical protein
MGERGAARREPSGSTGGVEAGSPKLRAGTTYAALDDEQYVCSSDDCTASHNGTHRIDYHDNWIIPHANQGRIGEAPF